MNKIVVGLGFGDEGKGLTTSFLSENSSSNSIVVRHNGGQQAGHTVEYKGRRHVFSQLGSGTLQGLPTYFTDKCTFYPPSFLEEYKLLSSLNPEVYLHPLTMITTPFDINLNRLQEDSRGRSRHGSVGLGFGQTIQRNEDFFTLYAQDLFYDNILAAKLYNIARVYYKIPSSRDLNEEIEYFLETVRKTRKLIKLENVDFVKGFRNRIFETAQGVLLDQHHGFFPNVTRSNTTSKNALKFIKESADIYYITRTYQTRHGNGYMSNEDKPSPILKNNSKETNVSHAYQGDFRISELDTELLKYALQSDINYSKWCRRNLVITCNDQLDIDVTKVINDLESVTKFHHIYLSYGPSLEDITQLK